jgi:elongation factor Tu
MSFRLTVQDVFFIRGRGVVATGRVEEGAIRTGAEVQVNGGQRATVDGIESFRKVLDEAAAGQNVGLLLKSLDRDLVKRGDVLTAVGDPAPAPAPAAAGSGRDPRFAAVEAQRTQLLSMRQSGLVNEAQIDESLRALIFATAGRQWLLKAQGPQWYSSVDGQEWRHAEPPG